MKILFKKIYSSLKNNLLLFFDKIKNSIYDDNNAPVITAMPVKLTNLFELNLDLKPNLINFEVDIKKFIDEQNKLSHIQSLIFIGATNWHEFSLKPIHSNRIAAMQYYLWPKNNIPTKQKKDHPSLLILRSMSDEEIQTELKCENTPSDIKYFIQKNIIKNDLYRIYGSSDKQQNILYALPFDLLLDIFSKKYDCLTLEEIKESLEDVFGIAHSTQPESVPVIFSKTKSKNEEQDLQENKINVDKKPSLSL